MLVIDDILAFIPSWFSGDVISVLLIIIKVAITIFLMKLALRMVQGFFKKDHSKLMNETISHLFEHILVAAIYFITLIIVLSIIPPFRSFSLALITGAGIAGIVVGMAAQNALGNIVSGISLAIFQPFRVGDYVSVHNDYGRVTDLSLRHTVISTWDNRRLIVPNSIISDEAIINWSIEDPTIMWPVDVGISYDSNIDLARNIMIEEARKCLDVMKYDEIISVHPDVLEGNDIKVLVIGFGDFAVNLRLLVWVKDRVVAYLTGCELRESIKKRFDAEGIEIPFPYRTVVYKKDLKPNASLQTGLTDFLTAPIIDDYPQDDVDLSGDSNGMM